MNDSGKNNRSNYIEDNLGVGSESISIRFLENELVSTPIFYEDMSEDIKAPIDDLASIIFDPDCGRAILLGYPMVGKTYIIEQFANNVDIYLNKSNRRVLNFIVLSNSEREVIERLPGTWGTYINFMKDELDCLEDEICFITEVPAIAASLSLTSKSVNVILEINVSSFVNIIQVENVGDYKLWKSWQMVDANDVFFQKKNLVESIYQELAPKYLKSNNYVLEKKTILVFVNYVIRSLPKILVKERLIVAPGLWVNTIKRIVGLTIFSSDPSLFERGEKVNGRIIKRVFEEYEAEFVSSISEISEDDDSDAETPNINDFFENIFGSAAGNIRVLTTRGQEQSSEEDNEISLEAKPFKDISTLGDRLKKSILGQDKAIDNLVNGLIVPAAGLHDDTKPLRSILFLGPTGVGKTQLALTLAKELFDEEMNVVRIDMSEYVHPADSSKLFGAAPGYVGYSEGGILTNSIKKHPHSLILLDEVEKAHPQVWDSFLQILDAGRMTSGDGETVDFRNTIIVMTSNLGAKDLNKRPSGFAISSEEHLYTQRQNDANSIIKKAVSEFFKPEFINRIDEAIIFNEISKETAKAILKKELNLIKARAYTKGFLLKNPNDDILETLLKMSDIGLFGAREIQRILLRNVSNPVAKKMLLLKDKTSSIKLILDANNKIIVEPIVEEIERGASSE